MWLRAIIILIVMSLVAAIQLAFLPNFILASSLNLALVVLVLMVFVGSRRNALFCAMTLGLLFDAWSFYWFGAQTLVFTGLTAASFIAVDNFFTNKSLYSYLFIIALATIVYDLYWLLIASWPGVLVLGSGFVWVELQKIGLNLALGVLLFYLALGLSNSCQSVVLVKRKY